MRNVTHRIGQVVKSGPCWTTLVAEAAGLGQLSVTRVEVVGVVDPGKSYRLVAHQLRAEHSKRPLASAQLTVDAAALARGLTLRLYSTDAAATSGSHVHVWVEEGPATLEYDGLSATDARAEFSVRCSITRGTASARLARSTRSTEQPPVHADAA